MDFIEDMKWWHWTVLSLLIGAALGAVNSAPRELPINARTMGPMDFQERVVRAPLRDRRNGDIYPWVTHIVVYPVTILQQDGATLDGQMVTYSVLERPDASSSVARIAPYATFMPYPFEPQPRPDATEDSKFPGTQVYIAESGDTLRSITAKFYGKDDGRRKAIIDANKSLRESANMARINLQAGEAYYIPWDPALKHTVGDFLDAADVKYQYAWWFSTKYSFQIWMASTFALVGVIWPIVIQAMIKGGFGRPNRKPKYDLSRFKSEADPKRALASTAMSAADMDQLQRLQEHVSASLKAGDGSEAPLEVASAEQGEAAKQPEIRKLKPGFAREVGPVEKTDEEKSYGGEYYPVQRPAQHNPDEKKP